MRIQPFQDEDAFQTFLNIVEQTIREIEALENDYILKASPVELEQHYVSKVTITPLTLFRQGVLHRQAGRHSD